MPVPSWQPVTREDAIEAFLNGRKETTLTAYRQDMADFAGFLGLTDRKAV